jgi:hypothetical protein
MTPQTSPSVAVENAELSMSVRTVRWLQATPGFIGVLLALQCFVLPGAAYFTGYALHVANKQHVAQVEAFTKQMQELPYLAAKGAGEQELATRTRQIEDSIQVLTKGAKRKFVLDATLIGILTAMAVIGTLLGLCAALAVADHYERKKLAKRIQQLE